MNVEEPKDVGINSSTDGQNVHLFCVEGIGAGHETYSDGVEGLMGKV